MNKATAEIFELEQMLREAHIPYEMDKMFDGYYIKVLNNDYEMLCDAVCHQYSHGYAEGMLEIMGGLTPAEETCDSVLGYLTAEEVFVRFQYCYEHNTPTYKEPKNENTNRLNDFIAYYNSLKEGDNIIITADFLAAIEAALVHIAWLENKIERMRSMLEE